MTHVLRPGPLAAAFAALGVATVLVITGHAPWWVLPAGVIGPDVSFLAALGAPPPPPGRMPERAVVPYNVVHHPAGPAVTAIIGLVAGSPTVLAAGMAWGSHLLWDRGVGYGMRARDGSIIGAG